MQRSTAVFLILLRLAIGWHFLVEGYLKVRSIYLVGPTVAYDGKIKQPFSSAGYLREAPGPLGELIRRYEGDPDEEALARLTVRPLPESDDQDKNRTQDRVPPGLHRDWEEYLKRFTQHYSLSAGQEKQARDKLRQAESSVVTWLTYVAPRDLTAPAQSKRYEEMTTEQTRTFPSGEIKRRMTMAERVAEYRSKVEEIHNTINSKLWEFGKDVEGTALGTKKKEVARLRSGLLADLEKQTNTFKEDLQRILNASQKEEDPVSEVKPTSLIDIADLITPWLLCAVGVGLLVGLFTRFWAILGAFFLLMTYLAIPSFPWQPIPVLPPPQGMEGSYLFINKNLIEMLALWVLAATPSGRWFGLDALLDWFWQTLTGKNKKAIAPSPGPAMKAGS